MKAKLNNTWGYSVIVSLLVVGFLIILTSGVFNLVLKEMNDTTSMGNYLKASAWAESSQELALLKIRHEGYGVSDSLDHSLSNESIVLSDASSLADFRQTKEAFVSYEIDSKANDYNGTLNPGEHDIIPLFYTNEYGEHKIKDYNFSVTSPNQNKLAWNIVGSEKWMSWYGVSRTWRLKKLDASQNFTLTDTDRGYFLENSDKNYLIVFNSDISAMNYSITSVHSGEYFTKPEAVIFSSGQVWGYKQNLKTTLDNSEYLQISKYSLFSK